MAGSAKTVMGKEGERKLEKYICKRCGNEFTAPLRRGPRQKLCVDCSESAAEERRKKAQKRYYAKKVGKTVEEIRTYRSKTTETPQASLNSKEHYFKWTDKKSVCKNEHCRFRKGDRPCLFYFEYKDGSFTCANMHGRVKREDK